MLNLTGIKKYYDTRCVLDIPALSVAKGERLSLIGPNGSGKSTLLRLLAGVICAEEGAISRLAFTRGDIAYLPQKPYAFDMSVEQNVLLALDGLEESKQRAGEALERVGLSHLRAARARRLSGGETQRLALARVIARPHKILLLDEPTASADIQAVERLEKALLDYQAGTGCTFIFSTHAPSQARRLSARALVLIDGTIAEIGETEQILQAPREEATKQFLQHWKI